MSQHFDDAIVGAGIIGLAHAYHLAKRGRRVLVLERNQRASGASVRNFGMLWPIGQPAGRLRAMALRSLDTWLTVLRAAGLWHERSGSLHLAYHEDEVRVLEEFATAASSRGFLVCEVLGPRDVLERCPSVRPNGLLGGLWSPTETCVDPREIIAGLPDHLRDAFGVEFVFSCAVNGYDRPRVFAGRRQWQADRLWVCTGDDLQTLYPEVYEGSGLVRCKLQMMRSQPVLPFREFRVTPHPSPPPQGGRETGGSSPPQGREPQRWRMGPMLAAGLTLRHYKSFAACPSLPALQERFARDMPLYDRYGIHVMVAQNGKGEIILGDSHEYGEAIEPFDSQQIEELILCYLSTFLEVPGLEIAGRWHGTYVKHPTEPYFVARPAPGVTAITGAGGAGMTLSFGLAEQVVGETLGES
jgi:glycine/D-amino acid oxidase-like deaminating enzyme